MSTKARQDLQAINNATGNLLTWATCGGKTEHGFNLAIDEDKVAKALELIKELEDAVQDEINYQHEIGYNR